MTIHIGTSGWNYPAWVGPFYPRGTRPAEFLSTYARAFRVVEVDSTFYATPDAKMFRSWFQRTPDDFTFALKMPKEITHEHRLVDADDVLAEFLDRARELGFKLGPILMQMSPDFGPHELPALERFLPQLPNDMRFAIEVRQRQWIERETLPSLLSLLAEQNVSLALNDARWFPRETLLDLAEQSASDFLYVRWLGPDREITDYSRVQFDRSGEIRSWADVLKKVANTKEIYGFFNNHFAGHSPDSARQLQELMGEDSVDPTTLGPQRSMF